MNIYHLAVQALANFIGENLHIARQHHQFHVFGIDESEQLRLRFSFSVFSHRNTKERHIIELR